MSSPYISIIMPVFNCQKYLCQSIESILGQTFADIELVCVDDCSTDNSAEIIDEYVKRDNRVKLLRHEKNMGPLKSRSDGVMEARGQFIMFLDSDDEFVRDACQKLYHISKRQKADIYGFGVEVICSNSDTKQGLQSYFSTYTGEVYGQDILQNSFVSHEFTRNLWDKMYEAHLCKKAFEMIWEDNKDQYWFSISADSFGFLYIAYYAASFFGVSDALYRYHFGRGSMGDGILSLDRFEQYCTSAIDVAKFSEIFAKRGVIEQYKQVVDAFRTETLNTCTRAWRNQISEEDKSEAMKIMLRYWPYSDIVEWLTAFWNDNCFLKVENGILKREKCWEAPFSVLPKGGRIVLYGAGDVGQDFYRQITDSGICEVVLWADRNYSALRDSGMPISAPEEISYTEFDSILIAIRDRKIAYNVKQFLFSLNIPESKVLYIVKNVDDETRQSGHNINREKILTPNMGSKWDDYYDNAEELKISSMESFIAPVIDKYQISLDRVLDFPSGRGRMADELYRRYYGKVKSIVCCDANAEAISFCCKRFSGNDAYEFFVNKVDEMHCFPFEFPDGEFSFVFSWDAMVHFTYKWIDFYVGEFSRILKTGGFVFMHHSNLGSTNVDTDFIKSENFNENPHWRALVSREDVSFISTKHGFNVVEQKVIDWGLPNLDCITVLMKP